MVAVINSINATSFSFNGVPYYKNFISVVSGDRLKVLNTYDSAIVLNDFSDYGDYTVDGSTYGSAALLQAALLPVLFTRSSLAGVTVNGDITEIDRTGNVVTFTLADDSTVVLDLNNLDQAQGLADHVNDTDNPHDVTKVDVGLANADNTSDADKPISDAQATVNTAKADKTAVAVHIDSPGDKTGLWVFGSGVPGINGGDGFFGLSNTASPTTENDIDEYII